MVKAGNPPCISGKTACRVLRKTGLKWARIQRKGILTKNELKLRFKFARKIRRKLFANFWEEGASLDGASFTHKINPLGQARAPRSMAWRKPWQGFNYGFTVKGINEGTVETVSYFTAAIDYGKGVTAAKQYHGRINAETFSLFVREHFARMFKKSANPRGKFSYRMVILHRAASKPDLPGMRLMLEKLPFRQEIQVWPYRKYLSYCQAEVASRCFGWTDNLRRFCSSFHKNQDYTGDDTYWCSRQKYTLHGTEN